VLSTTPFSGSAFHHGYIPEPDQRNEPLKLSADLPLVAPETPCEPPVSSMWNIALRLQRVRSSTMLVSLLPGMEGLVPMKADIDQQAVLSDREFTHLHLQVNAYFLHDALSCLQAGLLVN
jgi:hypothetical protein